MHRLYQVFVRHKRHNKSWTQETSASWYIRSDFLYGLKLENRIRPAFYMQKIENVSKTDNNHFTKLTSSKSSESSKQCEMWR